jgi:hypothetical protein
MEALMKNWTEVKSTLKEAQGLLKKGLGRYIVFSLPVALLSIGFVLLQTLLSYQIILTILYLGVAMFPRIGLITCITADQRGDRCTLKESFLSIKTHWPRVLAAYGIYWGIFLAAYILNALIAVIALFGLSSYVVFTIGYICTGLLVIWFGVRLLFMRYAAMMDPKKPFISHAFRLTKGQFWTLLRIHINTYSGWLLLFAVPGWILLYTDIRYAVHILDGSIVSFILSVILPLFLVVLEPYRTAAEVILYRRYREKIEAQEFVESADTDAGKPYIHTRPSDASFTYLKSDSEGNERIQGILDAWLAHYPSAGKSEPQRGIQSESAFYALFVHELLIRMDCSIKTQTNDRKFFITEMDRISLVLDAINIAREAMHGRDPVRTIRNILNQSRHGYAGQPYVIALNCPDFTTHRHDADILFGDNTGSGFWSPSKNTRVSAVLISSIHPESLLYPSIIVRLYLNPWAKHPYDGILTQLDTYRVDGSGLLQCIKGRNILDILGIDNSDHRE